MLKIAFVALSILLASTQAQPQPSAECVNRMKVYLEQCCPGVTPPYRKIGPDCELSDNSSGPLSCEAIVCTMREQGYLSADDDINKDAFLSAMNSYYSGDLKKAIQPAYDNCTFYYSTSSCHFGACFAREMFKACPITRNSYCSNAKSLIDKCYPHM